MLSYSLLKNHAGVLLTGDYDSLRALHEVVHQVNEKSPILKNKEGAFLALAYEVRKAYEQQRKVIKPPADFPEIGPRFGVELFWPELLVQSRMLRVSMSFIATTSWQQALAYNLEAIIESGLQADFAGQYDVLSERWMRINPAHPWPEEKLGSRSAIFNSWTKSDRRKRIAGLLASLDPMYPAAYSIWSRSGDTSLLSPEELDSWAQDD
ncbi:DUF6904 family protein [Rubrivivax gelatinosus]|uniref:DUF6904 family protein n=1 Tax=Rubrivivax gelatinosus TaxID=28068 RepID=UPI0009DB2EA3|nr:hypothetical protein [Rubrivivax gelatinosus]MBG6083046.1 hypothetical protein [Rubrivivax gelatinosus]